MRRNKKAFKKLGLMVGVTIFVAVWALLSAVESRYTREAIVTEIKEDRVIVEDTCGYIWSFVGEGYQEGEKVTLVMNNNLTTSNIKDDKIIKIK